MIPDRVLPPSWCWASFGEVATVASNLVNPANHQDLPHIAPNHIESRTGRLLPHTTVAEDGVTSSKHLFHRGQILYSKIRPYLAKAVEAPFDGLCSADMYPIDTTLIPRFLLYWLLTSEFTQFASQVQGRTVLPKINRGQLDALPVPVAPPREQERIVGTIEEQFSRLDAGVVALVRARQNLKRMRAVVLDAAVSGALIDVSSKEWQDASLGDLLEDIHAGKSFKCAERPSNPDEWGVVKVSAMTWGEFQEGENKTVVGDRTVDPRFEIRPGDLLVSRANTVEYVGAAVLVGKCRPRLLLSDKSLRLVPNSRVLSEWLLISLRTSSARRYIESVATGTSDSMRNISQPKLKALQIMVPPIDIQAQLVAEVHRIMSQVEQLEKSVGDNRRSVQALRWSILAAAFSGQLTTQDPTDELASTLLQRIAAERASSNGHRPTRGWKPRVLREEVTA